MFWHQTRPNQSNPDWSLNPDLKKGAQITSQYWNKWIYFPAALISTERSASAAAVRGPDRRVTVWVCGPADWRVSRLRSAGIGVSAQSESGAITASCQMWQTPTHLFKARMLASNVSIFRSEPQISVCLPECFRLVVKIYTQKLKLAC